MAFLYEFDAGTVYNFRSNSMTTKNDVLKRISIIRKKMEESEEREKTHSAGYYKVMHELINRFEKEILDTVLFDAPGGMWYFAIEVDYDGMELKLEHIGSGEVDEEHNLLDAEIDESFQLVMVKTKLLTVEEYAALYDVETVTVRQWIRRGKLRTAKKYGREWRIPELTEVPERGYKKGSYCWEEELIDLPEEYAFLKSPGRLFIEQVKNNKTTFRIWITGRVDQVLDAKQREELEILLITHPLVKYVSNEKEFFC